MIVLEHMKKEALDIFGEAISRVLPDRAVERALADRRQPRGRRILVAIGKAAWTMADAAVRSVGGAVDRGIAVTKYGHAKGLIEGVEIHEAGHPVPDEASFRAAERILAMTENLSADDEVLFLVSGGGSALFEKPQPGVSASDMAAVSEALLASGTDIREINAIRKRFSSVKGGRFAQHCALVRIFQVVLSDVVGDHLESIASGPACPDTFTTEDAARIAERYEIPLTPRMRELLAQETPKALDNVETRITGSVGELCAAAAHAAESRGYRPCLLTATLDCEAREAGRFAAAIARETITGRSCFEKPCALLMGGETVVHLRGKGKGGRSQELALAAAQGIAGLERLVILAAGSDGTDGPTDAAGGIVDGAPRRGRTRRHRPHRHQCQRPRPDPDQIAGHIQCKPS